MTKAARKAALKARLAERRGARMMELRQRHEEERKGLGKVRSDIAAGVREELQHETDEVDKILAEAAGGGDPVPGKGRRGSVVTGRINKEEQETLA